MVRLCGTRRAEATLAICALAMYLVALSAPSSGAAGQADGPPTRVFERHSLFTHEVGIDHPGGATYVAKLGLLAVAEQAGQASTVTLIRPATGDVVGRMTVPGLIDPSTLASDDRGRLAAYDGTSLITWPATARGTAAVTRTAVEGARVSRPGGMAYDANTNHWILLDADQQRLVSIAQGGGRAQAIEGASLRGLGAEQLTGVAWDAGHGRLYVGDPARELVYVVTGAGDPLQVLDVSDVELASWGSLSLGGTADPTDSSSTFSLYAADAGGRSSYGRVAEVSLTTMSAGATAAPLTSTATLVRKSLLSQLSPPSPDSSGVVYMSDLDRLLVADSEVEEMAIYQGVNLWQLSRDATTTHATGTTVKFSNEPTGVGYDPERRRMFVSDDSKRRVYEVTAGSDGLFGTPDDVTRYFSTSAFGNGDPEDVTYDTSTGDLFITEGLGAEVWRVSPGSNRVFDGVVSPGDDVVSHFDVGIFGSIDVEGIGYSTSRDSLFLADAKFTKILEVTKSGQLVQSIDVASIRMKNAAGITLAPATNDPTRLSLYVVARGVDNDKDPAENDGTMYELAAPYLDSTTPPPGPTNLAPVVDAGSDQSVQVPAAASLAGTVTDDALPDPPAQVTTSWSMVSGPGTVTFADSSALSTQASFSASGTYVLRLTASDSLLTSSDDVTVRVDPVASTNLVGNPGFETNLTGWKGSTGMLLERVEQPRSGSWSARLTNTGVGTTTCQLNDSPNWVTTTGLGRYTATAWVSGVSAGGTTRLRIREYVGSTQVAAAEVSVTLTTGWQELRLDYTPVSPGNSTLDLNVLRSTQAGAVCYLVDDVSMSSS